MPEEVTLFTTCKPFQGHANLIQRNALRSWKELCSFSEVLVFGNEAGVNEVCHELGFRNIIEVSRSPFGTPLLGDLFRQAERFAHHDYLAFINADIMLTANPAHAVQTIGKQFDEFLLIARRWNVEMQDEWDFQSTDWALKLDRYAVSQGTIEPPYGGADIFVYKRGMWDNLPPFAVGRTRWDSGLIYEARCRKIPVIDATAVLTCIHQNHDYSHIALGSAHVPKGPEATNNERLLNGAEFIFTPLNATHLLTGNGLKKNRTVYPPYLLRKLATLPALYKSFQPLAPLVRQLAPWWRTLRKSWAG